MTNTEPKHLSTGEIGAILVVIRELIEISQLGTLSGSEMLKKSEFTKPSYLPGFSIFEFIFTGKLSQIIS